MLPLISRVIRVASAGIAVVALSGCATSGITHAEPLDDNYSWQKWPDFSALPVAQAKVYLDRMMAESDSYCMEYFNRVSLTHRASDSALDIGSLALNGIGSAVSPVAAAHAFSAAAGVATGTRATLDTDVYMQSSVQALSDAMYRSYRAQLNDVAKRVDSLTASGDGAGLARDITFIHQDCSISAASRLLNQALAKVGPAPETPTSGTSGATTSNSTIVGPRAP